MTLVMGPYHAMEDHPGHRSTAVQTWYAEDSRSGHEVALTVVSPVPPEVAHQLVEVAGAVRQPHLLPVLDVIVDGQRVGLISAWPSVGRLSDLLDRRGPLTAGETLTVLRPLAATLAAIHRHGLVHGNLSAAVVWFDDSGRPLLGGLAAGLLAAHAVPGRDAAPERAGDLAPECARGAVPSVAADVFSLGSVALFCLTGRSAWPADDTADVLVQSVGGVWPDVSDAAAPPRLVSLIRRMLAADPATRPEATAVLAELQRSGVAAPVDLAVDGAGPTTADGDPDRPVSDDPSRHQSAAPGLSGLTAMVLGPASAGEPEPRDPAPNETPDDASTDPSPAAHWGTARHSGAVRTGPPIVRRRPNAWDRGRSGADDGFAGAGFADGADDGFDPARRRHGREQGRRARRLGSGRRAQHGPAMSGSRRAAVLGLLVALVVVLGAIAKQAWSADPDGVPPTAAAATPGPTNSADWLTVVTELDTARAEALSNADPALLDRVYTTSAAQRTADTAVVADLAARGLRVRDGTHQIASVSLVPAAGSDPAGSGTAGSGTAGSDPAGSGTAGSGTVGSDPAGSGTAGSGTAGSDTAGSDTAGSDTAGSDTAGSDAPGTGAVPGGPDGPGSATVQVAVVDALPSYPIVDQTGSTVGRTIARPAERRILVLAVTGQGYRIDAIRSG